MNEKAAETILLCIVFVPTFGALLLPPAGLVSPKLRNLLALVFVACSFVLSLTLIPLVASGRTVDGWALPYGLGWGLHADSLAVFMAIVSSFVSSIILLYSTGYIRPYGNQNEYYLMVVLFLGAMMGLVFARNLIILYVFWEITAIASWRLIGFFREKQHVRRADKAFLVTVFGALAMLLGFIALGQQAGSFDLEAIRNYFDADAARSVSGLAIVLILMGILSKSATLPFHTWLPDAGVAPSPVTALLHAAVLVKIGVYVFARLFVATLPALSFGQGWHTAMMVIAAASALVSAGAAMIDTDLKRIIAYSTVSQIGFIFLGFAMGSEIGVSGALLYILMHGLAKGGLFLCAGIVEQKTHTKDITKMGGLIKVMPVTAISFLFCAFSVMGVPPFGGFFSKYMVISSAVDGNFWIAITFLLGAFMTIIYLLRVFAMVFLGQGKFQEIREGSPVMVTCVAALALISLAAGVAILPFSQFAHIATGQMLGH
jgi:proton-translocating NADH-quinone oxidoreductase chain N